MRLGYGTKCSTTSRDTDGEDIPHTFGRLGERMKERDSDSVFFHSWPNYPKFVFDNIYKEIPLDLHLKEI